MVGVDIAGNVAQVRATIAAACVRAQRDPATVRLIAVTKTQEPSVLQALAQAGVGDIGENRLEHLTQMAQAAPPGMRLHAIGRLQGRAIPGLVALATTLHSLADPSHVPRLDHACRQHPGRQVFVQVNTSGEAAKAGVTPEALPALLTATRGCAFTVVGLMTMAPALGSGVTEAEVRRCFARLAALARAHGLPRLSMGMSQDYPIAVEEGATDVRIGTRLFV